MGETLCEQRVVAMSFLGGFFISGVVLCEVAKEHS